VGEHGGGGSDAADEGEQPEAEHGEVNRDADSGIDRAHRADRRERGEPDRHADCEQRSENDGGQNPE
jgi:hypothetical protein